MQEHSRYEELCAAAGIGQISPEELRELAAHTETCSACRELQSDLIEISSVWLPQAHQVEPRVYDPQSALRRNILGRLEGAGARFSPAAHKDTVDLPARIKRLWISYLRFPAPAFAVALVIVAAGVGYGAGVLRNHYLDTGKTPPTVATVEPFIKTRATAPIATSDGSRTVPGIEQELRHKLAASETENATLHDQAKVLEQQISGLQDAKTKDATTVAQLQATIDQHQASSLSQQAEIQKLKSDQDAKDADLAAFYSRVHELEAKLSEQSAQLERDHQLMALSSSSAVQDVIASRSVHIIDVADVENGGVRKPFGRVFYTEGRSLIFYAYDLSKAKNKQTFYAWGRKEGDPHTDRVLGVMQSDDATQNRWVFKFNDAKVLAQIDSVYVTLEPNSTPGKQPKGTRVLNAYLGTPANHP